MKNDPLLFKRIKHRYTKKGQNIFSPKSKIKVYVTKLKHCIKVSIYIYISIGTALICKETITVGLKEQKCYLCHYTSPKEDAKNENLFLETP